MRLEKPESMQWTSHVGQNGAGYHAPAPLAPSLGNFYHHAQNGMSYNNNYNLTYASQYPSASCPRSYNDLDLIGLPKDVSVSESYPPAAYQIEPHKPHDLTATSDAGVNDHLMQTRDDYEHYYGAHIRYENHGGYLSPHSDMTRASTPNDEPPRYPHGLSSTDDIAIDKEQPYAQLIYKALLQADGHTMILRDIYDWFKKYTDKAAASETKGWQNSIRHNLSMNGVRVQHFTAYNHVN